MSNVVKKMKSLERKIVFKSEDEIARYDTVSNSVLVQSGITPAEVINQAKFTENSHLAWIPSHPSPNSWGDIQAAIQADPLLDTDCPNRYFSCVSG